MGFRMDSEACVGCGHYTAKCSIVQVKRRGTQRFCAHTGNTNCSLAVQSSDTAERKVPRAYA